MTRVVFDTSVLIDYLRGNKSAVDVIERVARGEVDGYISVVTEAELYAGKECGTEAGLARVKNIIPLFTKILLNNEIAHQAGLFRRKYRIEIPDAIIAATATVSQASVWTKNVSDFGVIKETTVEDPY